MPAKKMSFSTKYILLIFWLFLDCVNRDNKSDNNEYYKQLTIEDDYLITEFDKVDDCKKIEIIEYFKADMLPAGEGHSQKMIETIEKITKKESRRLYTHFGAGYNDEDDFDNDIQDWKGILKCN
jgi:hypothetical protein